MGKFALG